MKVTLIKYLDIDIGKIRKWIDKAFRNTPSKRRITRIVNEFEKRNFQKALDLINALPYNKKDECSEKEYVPAEIYDFYQLSKDHEVEGYDYKKKP